MSVIPLHRMLPDVKLINILPHCKYHSTWPGSLQPTMAHIMLMRNNNLMTSQVETRHKESPLVSKGVEVCEVGGDIVVVG